jgi:hypothetical protein
MNARGALFVVSLLLSSSVMAQARDADGARATQDVGKVSFPTSCDPRVQAQFERGVAMLHSY